MKVNRFLSIMLSVAMLTASLPIFVSAAEEGTASADVYKASDAWYEPTEDAAENTYNNHTEWKWQRKDNNKDWYDFSGFKTDKNYFYPVAGETTGTVGGAWTTGSTAGWNHPGVGENWMQPLCAAGATENAVSKAFTAPKDGVVKLSTEDGFICGGSSDPSMNAYVCITLNGEKIWPADGTTQPLTTSSDKVDFIPIYNVKVAKGDVLRFEAYNGTAVSSKMYGKRVWWKPVVTYSYKFKASDAWSDTTNTDSVWRWLYRDNATASAENPADQYVEYTLKGTGDTGGFAAPTQNEDGSYDYATKSGAATVFSDSSANPGMRNALGQYWARPSVATGSEPKQSVENRIVKQFTAPKSGAVTISAEDMSGAAKIYNKTLNSDSTKNAYKGAVVSIKKKADEGDIVLFTHDFQFEPADVPANGLAVYDFKPIRTNLAEGDKLWFEVSGETGGSAYAKQVFWDPVVAYEYEPESISPANTVGVPLNQSFTLTFADEIDTITADKVSINGGASVKSFAQSEDGKTITVAFDGLDYDTDYSVSISGVKPKGTVEERFSGFSFTTTHKTVYKASDAWNENTNTDGVWRWLYRDNATANTENEYVEYTLKGTGDTGGYGAPIDNEDGSYDYATRSGATATVFTDETANAGMRNALGQYWARLSVATGSEPKQGPENRIVKQFTAPAGGTVIISAEDMSGNAKIYNKNLGETNTQGALCLIKKKTADGTESVIFEYDFKYSTATFIPDTDVAVYDFEDITTELAAGDRLWFEISSEPGGNTGATASGWSKQVFWDPVVIYSYEPESIAPESRDSVPLNQSFTLTFTNALETITADKVSISGGASVKSFAQSEDGKTITVDFNGLRGDTEYSVSIAGVKPKDAGAERASGFSFTTEYYPLHVSASGTANGSGTQESPLTLEEALNRAKDGREIIIDGTVTPGEDFEWPKTGRSVIISGSDENSKLDIKNIPVNETTKYKDFNIYSDVTFENLIIVCESAENEDKKVEGKNRIAANGYHVIIKESVMTDGVIGTLIGGSIRASVASTNLEVYGGNYNTILGGSDHSGSSAVHVNGDCHLTVGGNVNSDLEDDKYIKSDGSINWDHTYIRKAAIHGGGLGGSVKGDSTLTLKGNAKAKYVYGGQNGEITAQNMGKVTVNIEGGSFMNVYAILKNTKNESNAAANVEGTVAELTMTGGTVEALIGAQEAVLGDIRINAMSGTVTRRIIGGTYNEVEKSSNTDGHVTGTTTVIIGKDLELPTPKGINIYSKGIYPGSRTTKTFEEEVSTIIFLGDTYDKFSNKLTDTYHKDEAPLSSQLLSKSKWDYLVDASAGGSVEPTATGAVKLIPDSGKSMLVNNAEYTEENLTLTQNKIAKVVFYSGDTPPIEPYISELTCTPGSEGLTVGFDYAAAAENDMLYVALYDGNQLLYVQPKTVVYSGVQNTTVTIPYQTEQGKSYTVKAFLWDNASLTPCCDASRHIVTAQ